MLSRLVSGLVDNLVGVHGLSQFRASLVELSTRMADAPTPVTANARDFSAI
jgi:hypothetical protein